MDDNWDMGNQAKTEEKQIPVKEQPAPRGRNRRGEEKSNEDTKPQPQPQYNQKANENQEDSWIIDNKKETSAAGQRQLSRQEVKDNRGQSVQNSKVQEEISQIIHPEATELTPQQAPKEKDDDWLSDDNRQKKQEQLKRDEAEQEPGNRFRGNRGNRGNRGRNEEQNQFVSNKNQNNEDNQEQGRRGNRGNRDYNRGQNQEGYRNYGRNNQDRNQEGGNRYGGRDRQERGERGERGGYRGRGRGGFEGNRDRNDRNERNFRNDQGDREDRNGNGRNFRNYNNDRNYNNQAEAEKKPFKEQKVQSISCVNLRRAWPSCQIFIYGRKLAITLRKVQHFNSKILMVPYRNLKFDYYPGNFVNSSSIGYKDKISKKGEQLEKGGSVCFQRAIGLGEYQALVFLRIDQSNKEQNLQNGIEYIMKHASYVQSQKPLDSLVFPLSKDLGQPRRILQIFSKCLQTYKTIKQVYITTNQPQVYEKCMKDFSKYLMTMIDDNELSLD